MYYLLWHRKWWQLTTYNLRYTVIGIVSGIGSGGTVSGGTVSGGTVSGTVSGGTVSGGTVNGIIRGIVSAAPYKWPPFRPAPLPSGPNPGAALINAKPDPISKADPKPEQKPKPSNPDAKMGGVNMPNSHLVAAAKQAVLNPEKSAVNPSGTQKVALKIDFLVVAAEKCEPFTWDDPCDEGFEIARHSQSDGEKVGDEEYYEFEDSLQGVERAGLSNQMDTVDSLACRNHCDRFSTLLQLSPPEDDEDSEDPNGGNDPGQKSSLLELGMSLSKIREAEKAAAKGGKVKVIPNWGCGGYMVNVDGQKSGKERCLVEFKGVLPKKASGSPFSPPAGYTCRAQNPCPTKLRYMYDSLHGVRLPTRYFRDFHGVRGKYNYSSPADHSYVRLKSPRTM